MPTRYHQALRRARAEAGYTLDDVLVEMRTRLPKPMLASKGTLQRIETAVPEDKADIHLVEFLCTLYGVDVADVSPLIAQALEQFKSAVTHLAADPHDRPFRSRCDSPGAQPTLPGFDFPSWMGATSDVQYLLVNAA